MSVTQPERDVLSKVEVLRDLEGVVFEMMTEHDRKRELWFPVDLIGPREGEDPEKHRTDLQKRASGIPDHARAALALNTLTEEGLPHFHRLLAIHLGEDSHWRSWNATGRSCTTMSGIRGSSTSANSRKCSSST